MPAVGWIDIVSPTLRRLHQAWCELRGPQHMAHLNDYNAFVAPLDIEYAACVLVPGDGGSPWFRHVGPRLQPIMHGCKAGTGFHDIASQVVRAAVTAPFHRVISGRQPDCRRGQYVVLGRTQGYEQLLLPFANNAMRVCAVQALYDMSGRH
ncbi:MAG: hypothetical protein OHK0024_13420 [Thalassobaculales bacterium]